VEASVPGRGTSERLYERAGSVMPGGNTRTSVFFPPSPPYAQRGHGCRVVDVDGTELIDFVNNYTSLIHGHAEPHIVAAVQEQLALGTCFALPTESEVGLAELICARVPSIESIRFTNSGTEAVMMAIKAARAFTGRPKIAKCEGAYHGSYDYAEVSLDPQPSEWGDPAPRPVAYARGAPESALADVVPIRFNGDDAIEHLRPHAEHLAAIVVDLLPNRVGLMPVKPGFLAALRAFADETGALLIFDEVISFRLGRHGAQGMVGTSPDLTALGKVIGGGFPIGAVGGRRDVMGVFDPRDGRPPLPHGGTFNANPISMIAGQVAVELLDEAAFAHLARLGQHARDGIADAFAGAGCEGQVTGTGSLLRVHYTSAELTGYRSVVLASRGTAELAAGMHRYMLENGILMSPTGLMAVSTPMGMEEIDRLVDVFARGLRAVGRRVGPTKKEQ
jgi:glutamate-1-semialdehyde 2,1-aminomutase